MEERKIAREEMERENLQWMIDSQRKSLNGETGMKERDLELQE